MKKGDIASEAERLTGSAGLMPAIFHTEALQQAVGPVVKNLVAAVAATR